VVNQVADAVSVGERVHRYANPDADSTAHKAAFALNTCPPERFRRRAQNLGI
jgi:hypothetical protein